MKQYLKDDQYRKQSSVSVEHDQYAKVRNQEGWYRRGEYPKDSLKCVWRNKKKGIYLTGIQTDELQKQGQAYGAFSDCIHIILSGTKR